jgi:hypothetical protein
MGHTDLDPRTTPRRAGNLSQVDGRNVLPYQGITLLESGTEVGHQAFTRAATLHCSLAFRMHHAMSSEKRIQLVGSRF